MLIEKTMLEKEALTCGESISEKKRIHIKAVVCFFLDEFSGGSLFFVLSQTKTASHTQAGDILVQYISIIASFTQQTCG